MPLSGRTLDQISRGTALPSAPYDGQYFLFTYDDTGQAGTANNEVLIRYDSAASGSYKWHPVGQPVRLYKYLGTNEIYTGGASYGNTGTTATSITVPLAGDWEVQCGLTMNSTSASAVLGFSYKIGATAAITDDGCRFDTTASGSAKYQTFVSPVKRQTSMAASTVLLMQFYASTGNLDHIYKWISATPIRVG